MPSVPNAQETFSLPATKQNCLLSEVGVELGMVAVDMQMWKRGNVQGQGHEKLGLKLFSHKRKKEDNERARGTWGTQLYRNTGRDFTGQETPLPNLT